MVEKIYLTASFALRPTRRKAAAMERVRATAETIFWEIVNATRKTAEVIALEQDKRVRHAKWRTEQKNLLREIIVAGARAGVAEPISQGLVRDVTTVIGSFIELRAKDQATEWPERRQQPVRLAYKAALEELANSTTAEEHENFARDKMARAEKDPGPRPLTLARARDAMLVRTGETGNIAVVLNVLRAAHRSDSTGGHVTGRY